MKVICRHPHGIKLRLFEIRSLDPNDVARAVPVGDAVVLKKGVNDIDGDFFEEWLHQNEGSKLLDVVSEVK